MANNRIYLKCNVCGEMLYLGKSFAMGYYWENYGKLNGDPNSPPLEDRLNEFFEKHTYCNNEGNDGDYSIEYESPFRDIVEVVRCKGCVYWDTDGYGAEFDSEGFGWCDHNEFDSKIDWYCADGERREDDTD